MREISTIARFFAHGLRLIALPCACAFLILLTLPAPASGWFGLETAVPSATAARLGGNGIRTRFVVDLSVAVNFNAYVIPHPYRVVIDLQEVKFDLPPASGSEGRGLVTTYRYGLMDQGRSRIVMETKGPVLIEKAFVVDAEGGQPARIVIDLVPADEKDFARLYQQQLPPKVPPPDPDPALALPFDSDGIPQELAPLGGGMLPEATEPATEPPKVHPLVPDPPARTAKPRPVIVLDPGHGGIDPGAVSRNGTTEKSIALAFAQELQKRLAASGRYDIVLTRAGDTFLSLKDRVRIARKAQADLFLAIHADVVRGAPVRGATVYTLSDNASDTEAEALARDENRADLIAGVNLTDENDEITGILIDLALRETKNHSLVFARSMVKTLKPVIEMTNRPVRSAGFLVLKAPDVPSVLLELGYLSNQADEKLLASPQWRAGAAKAVAQAIDDYFVSRLASGG
ncbi:MAG: N-acetylmuramoyl-L-alanine amidase [Aestuariivirgaceae bacterium]